MEEEEDRSRAMARLPAGRGAHANSIGNWKAVGSKQSPKESRRYAPQLSYLSQCANLKRHSSRSKIRRCMH